MACLHALLSYSGNWHFINTSLYSTGYNDLDIEPFPERHTNGKKGIIYLFSAHLWWSVNQLLLSFKESEISDMKESEAALISLRDLTNHSRNVCALYRILTDEFSSILTCSLSPQPIQNITGRFVTTGMVLND